MPRMHHAAEIPENFTINLSTTGRIFGFLKPYWLQVILALICLLAFSTLQLAGPYIIKSAIDGPIADKNYSGLLRLTAIYMMTILGSFIAMFSQIYTMALTGQSIMNDIRKSLFKHIQSLDIRFFDKFPTGWIITRLTSDIETLNELFSSGVVQFIGDSMTLIGIVVIMFSLNTRLTIFVLLSMVLFAVNVILFRKKFRDSFRAVRTKVAALNGFLSEHIRGIHVIQLFNNNLKVREQFDRANQETLNAHLQTVFYFALFVPTVEITSAITIVLLLKYGGFMIQGGGITVGVLVAFFQYARRFFRPIQDMSQQINILQSALASSERIFQVMDMSTGVSEPLEDDAVIPETIVGEIRFENVWFAYNNEEWVMKDVSFVIHPGESIAVVGATGAGKTTLTNLLCRFYDPVRGVIRLDGTDIRKIPLNVLRGFLGLIHQDAFIFNGSIADNIRVGRQGISDMELERIAEQSGLATFINRMSRKFATEVGEGGRRLSAGQKQLVSFMRTISFNPQIVILDEATSNIDTVTESVIQIATEKILKGRTALVVAHRLSTIRNADRIFVFHKGHLAESGTHDELLKKQNGIYPRLHQLYYAGKPG
ncbi:ABC transporter ATP-binding protein [bacterium]|nr:ABC transporter ATP-binding protein [candidate division CSSED10-310 bacterium]